eukprot:scaffold308774_cov19-Tisochrysis_lutea.AAC.1
MLVHATLQLDIVCFPSFISIPSVCAVLCVCVCVPSRYRSSRNVPKHPYAQTAQGAPFHPQFLCAYAIALQELEERAQASMDTDCPEGAAPQLPPGEAELMSCANERPLHEHALRYAAQQAQHAATAAAPGVSQGTHEAASNQDHGSKPPADKMDQAQTAGGRAAHMLPVVLGLVEAVVEALACDAAAADAAAEDGGMEVEVE